MQKENVESLISKPENIHLSLLDYFYLTVKQSDFSSYLEPVLFLLDRSLVVDSTQLKNDLDEHLLRFRFEEFNKVIHLMNIALFVRRVHEENLSPYDLTPVSINIKKMLTKVSVEEALQKLSVTLIDVLTAHPVDMDRGLIVSHKQEYEALCKEWQQKKEIYESVDNEKIKITIRTQMNSTLENIRNVILQFLYTPNYRQVKIKPESEQRHLSRSVKDYESVIVKHWNKLVVVVQVVFFQALLNQLLKNGLETSEYYESYLVLPYTQETLDRLKKMSELKTHFLYSHIIDIPNTLSYQLETWRGDMDGNPFVNHITFGLSTAYGRKRSFERLSADDAVIRYSHAGPTFKSIETDLEARLFTLLKEGEPAWKAYIKRQQKALWSVVQIYSGLAYFRMVELTEAAELYLRNQEGVEALKRGFVSSEQFLKFTKPLEEIEQSVGIENGVWAYNRNLVKLRQLSLGRPHIRKGELFHVQLIIAYANFFGFDIPTDFFDRSDKEQLDILNRFLRDFSKKPIEPKLISDDSLNLYNEYLGMMVIDDQSTLIQSDSGEVMKSIKGSVALLKIISKLIGHSGRLVVLCEKEESMYSAIELMRSEKSVFFEKVIMMCAGSDNQKKLGPFYSAYLNHLFLSVAYQKGVLAFFGVGDSPLRSSMHTPISPMKTFQPGSRKHHFFGERIYPYLSARLANHIVSIEDQISRTFDCSDSDWIVFRLFGKSMYEAYKKVSGTQTELYDEISSISEIVTTYFSRPSKKSTEAKASFDQIRAIDAARAQIILNTFDPQLAGFNEGVELFFNTLKQEGLSIARCQHFFNDTSEGNSILQTLSYFATMLDDTLVTNPKIRTVSQKDILSAFEKLSGKKLKVSSDPYLRLVRLFWSNVNRRSNLSDYIPQTLMLFGSNWMV